MRVLITGAAGFIGSNLTHLLADRRPDWKITALDALTYAGNLANIAGLIDKKRVEFSRTDIVDAQAVSRVFEAGRFDAVLHLAAESHVDRSLMDGAAFVRTNVLGTQHLISAARETGVKRFVHISTDEVYGSLGPTGRFVETTPLDPSSPYSASKAASDLMVLAAFKSHGFPGIVTRCTNNYGPYHFPEKLIPLFISNALENKALPVYGDGMQVRSWLYVEDHCLALLAVLEGGRVGEVYNIGGAAEAEIPNIETTKAILRAVGKPESLIQYVADRPGHDRRYAIDYTKINRELGWKPLVQFEAGLKRTVEWYLKNQDWWRSIKSGDYMRYYERQYGSGVQTSVNS